MLRSTSPLRPLLFLLSPLVLSLPAANAATFTVSNLNDSGPGSLRAAITAANATPAADTIDASGRVGNIKLLTALPTIQNTLTLRGSGATHLIVRRNSTASFRLFTVGKDTTLNLFDLSLSGGGGGLETGGAIANEGTLTLENCVVSGNAARRGGAIYSTGSVTVKGCTFSGNSASGGGAIASSNGFLTVAACTFKSNSAVDDGGALDLQQTRTSLASSTFSGNRAGTGKQGGAVQATGNFDLSRAGLDVQNCTFTGNSAGQGGALWVSGQRLQLQNATITGNTANTGAGVWSEGDTKTLTFVSGSIVAGNNASASVVGNDVDTGPTKNTFVSRYYNLIGGGSGRSSFSSSADKSGLTRTQLQLGVLKSNGGPTQTLLPTSSSPAVDGIPLSYLAVTVDQRGVARPRGEAGDIGAVEFDTPPSSFKLVVNTDSDNGDGACTASECTLREALAAGAALSTATQKYTITFDTGVFSTQKTIRINQPTTFGLGLQASGNLDIIGPGANLLTITLGNVTEYGPRLLNTNGTISISGITFKGGRPYRGRGGAILNSGTLSLTNCVLSNNTAEGGAGGALLNTGDLSLRLCTVSDNFIRTYGLDSSGTGFEKSFGGGGIYNRGTLRVAESAIFNNTAANNCLGGGIYNEGTAYIESSSIYNNSGNAGGGIYSVSSGLLSVVSSAIGWNVSNYYNFSSPQTGSGGGIQCIGPLLLRNSTVAENSCSNPSDQNGGVWVTSSNATIENSTIAGNYSGYDINTNNQDGALTVSGGTVSLRNNCIVSKPGAYRPDIMVINGGTVVSGGYNFVGFGNINDTRTDDYLKGPGDKYGGYPLPVLDARLGILNNNGGQVLSIAPLADSPLINAGEPNFNTSTLPYDTRGPGFPRVVGGRLDIGAFETQSSASASKKPTPTTKSSSASGS